MSNANLHQAKKSKNDEFYTQYEDVENELKHYPQHFKNKIVYCNCDTAESNFVKYFQNNFDTLGLKDLLYSADDFRKNTEMLERADIVVSNPPFSLFKDYIAQLFEYEKKFLVIGSVNKISRIDMFSLLQKNLMWTGCTLNGTGQHWFIVPKDSNYSKIKYDENGVKYARLGNLIWFTNLDHHKRHLIIPLTSHYNPALYPKYDNCDAINVDKVVNIPADYDGIMGVPITYLKRHNPDQFKILGMVDYRNESGLRTKIYTKEDVPNPATLNRGGTLKINGEYKPLYARILIQRI